MSSRSSSSAGWFTRLEPLRRPEAVFQYPDDPRLGEIVEFWNGDPAALRPGRAVLIGFPQDEGVRRNHGRPGAAEAPHEIRRWLYHLTPWEPPSDIDLTQHPPLDAGNLRIQGDLEDTQQALGEVVAGVLATGAVPIVLGGGHETAFGHYLGYVQAQRSVAVLNIDAHLDVRPLINDKGHSGSPFRQAMEHPTLPLRGKYCCLGVRWSSTSRAHHRYALENGCLFDPLEAAAPGAEVGLRPYLEQLAQRAGSILMTVDADAFRAADVPGVSAPNVNGLPGEVGLRFAREAGRSPQVSSFELVEINPRFDRDGQSARWGGLMVWHFMMGLASRGKK
jgi:formiminoglutamase